MTEPSSNVILKRKAGNKVMVVDVQYLLVAEERSLSLLVGEFMSLTKLDAQAEYKAGCTQGRSN